MVARDIPRIIPDRSEQPDIEANVTRSWTAKDKVTGRVIAKGDAVGDLLDLEVASKKLRISHDQWTAIAGIGSAWERTWE